MQKKLLVFLATFISFSLVNAQPGFNILVDAGHPRNDIWDMVVVNDTIIGYGFGFKDSTYLEQGLILTKFDSSGNLLKSNFIVDTLGSLSINRHWGKIIATSDGGFAMTTSLGGGSNIVLLIKTDSELEVEFIKKYPDSIHLTHYWYRLIEVDDGYMLYGIVQLNNLVHRPFLRKVDKQGNTEWLKYYGDGLTDEILFEGQQINDSLFVFGGLKGEDDLFEIGRAMILYTDENGEIVDSWFSEKNSEIGYIRRLQVLEDGDLLLSSQYEYSHNGSYSLVQPTLARMTPDFGIKWVKHFGLIDRWDESILFLDMASLSNGEWVGAGHGLVDIDGESRNSGWLMKFNMEGDSIWSRYDFPSGLPVEYLYEDTFFGGVGVLSSGSIIAGGTATIWSGQSIWLVKVTTDGCLEVINCGLVPTYSTPQPADNLSLQLSPNPASGWVKATWATNAKETTLLLYNLQGQLLEERKTPQGETETWFDTGGLPSGIYFMEIRDRSGHFVEKFVKTH